MISRKHMPDTIIYTDHLQGLQEKDISSLQLRYGKNVFEKEHSRKLFYIIWDILREPMFIILMIACSLYFILGEVTEGMMMIAAMFFVAAISIFQENRSTKALEALKHLTAPKVLVIRDGKEKTIPTEDLLPGDIIILEEGDSIPADATILRQNDLSVNESVITGESFPVEKSIDVNQNILYQGTTINSGKCIATVTATGNHTVLGKLGRSITGNQMPKTILQEQIGRLVRRLALFGLSAFIIIWLVNYYKTDSFVQSLLFGLTLAMAVIPEEIPVALSSFMALGAFQMSKLGIISRQPQTIENLGAISVICLDKTGTITENKMEVKNIYDHSSGELVEMDQISKQKTSDVLWYAMLASEQSPFDAMEKAIVEAYNMQADHPSLKMIHEYPLEGKPPMMTHVYQQGNNTIVAAKGAVERILRVCAVDAMEAKKIHEQVTRMASQGYRVIAVASAVHEKEMFPQQQDEFSWTFQGLLSLYDPPRQNTGRVFKQFYDAKINVKLLTGDYAETAMNIAGQVGMLNYRDFITGDEVMKMTDGELKEKVKQVNMFARMFPEAKLKVIDTLKSNGEIVAMTGDGVNDAPALRSANIGIAMGNRGTEIARQAADLILTDDNLDKVTEAIQQGRKIFGNLKKAVRYIISIHIPIILTAALPALAGWKFPNIFTPVHIIFLELIMGPTCSVFFEREPVEGNIMKMPPRNKTAGLFRKKELLVSIAQGLVIATAILLLYYFFMTNNYSIGTTRSIVFTTLVLANIFLTFSNRSFSENILKTIFYRNGLAVWVLLISSVFLLAIHLVPFIRNVFGLDIISFPEFLLCTAAALVSVMWIEIFKVRPAK